MRRLLSWLALAAALTGSGPAAARSEPHEHRGFLFELRFEPELNDTYIYRAFLADPEHPASLIIERGNGGLGDRARIDVTPASCPAAAAQVARLASLPIPAVALEDDRPVDLREREPASYHFGGFVHFPNGGEGEVTFYAYDRRGQRADPLLAWARGLVRAVDACRPRTPND